MPFGKVAGSAGPPGPAGATGATGATGAAGASGLSVPGGRLTLTSATPVLTTDTTGATTIYYALYLHDQVPIYDGSNFVSTTFTELSLAVGTKTSGANYDVFIYSNSGTPTLVFGPAWSSNTARGTGAGTTELERVKGIWTNKVDISGGPAANRGTFLGTIRTTSTTATGCRFGSGASRTGGQWYVWNAYNRSPVDLTIFDSTASWTYNDSTTFQVANASTGVNIIEYVCGLQTDQVAARVSVTAKVVGSSQATVGVGVDSASSNSAAVRTSSPQATNPEPITLVAEYAGFPGIGYHALSWLEYSNGGSTTFYGASYGGQSGMTSRIFA